MSAHIEAFCYLIMYISVIILIFSAQTKIQYMTRLVARSTFWSWLCFSFFLPEVNIASSKGIAMSCHFLTPNSARRPEFKIYFAAFSKLFFPCTIFAITLQMSSPGTIFMLLKCIYHPIFIPSWASSLLSNFFINTTTIIVVAINLIIIITTTTSSFIVAVTAVSLDSEARVFCALL